MHNKLNRGLQNVRWHHVACRDRLGGVTKVNPQAGPLQSHVLPTTSRRTGQVWGGVEVRSAGWPSRVGDQVL